MNIKFLNCDNLAGVILAMWVRESIEWESSIEMHKLSWDLKKNMFEFGYTL